MPAGRLSGSNAPEFTSTRVAGGHSADISSFLDTASSRNRTSRTCGATVFASKIIDEYNDILYCVST
jgi:hypothetical protein